MKTVCTKCGIQRTYDNRYASCIFKDGNGYLGHNWQPGFEATDSNPRMVFMPTSPQHYARYKIQPIDFITENKLGFCEGNVIKYVCRYDAKNGVEDLEKAKVYLEKLIEREKRLNVMPANKGGNTFGAKG